MRLVILICFFFSGATGLIYEVIWSRQLAITFGCAAPSVGIVIASFMAGLGLGAVIIGSFADTIRRPLRLYAFCEGIIAIYALLFPHLLSRIPVLADFLRNNGAGYDGLLTGTTVFMLLVVPTFLMGGTLPLLGRVSITSRSNLRSGLSVLYAVNTGGAVVGALAAGYVLIARVGMEASLALAALINCLIMIMCWYLDSRVAARGMEVLSEQPPAPGIQDNGVVKDVADQTCLRGTWSVFFAILYGLSGFLALAGQIVWTRLFSLILGNTSYGLSAVLVAYLTGISLGSAMAPWIGDRIRQRHGLFFLLQSCMGISSLGLGLLIVNVPQLMGGLFQAYGFSFFLFTAMQATLMFFLLLPITVPLGMLFPLVTDMVTTSISSVGSRIGLIYLANTIGATAGSLISTFILIPAFGLHRTIFFLALGCLIVGCAMAITVGGWLSEGRRSGVIVALLFSLFAGLFLSRDDIVSVIHRDRLAAGWTLDRVYEDMEGTVAVASEHKDSPVHRLYINGNPSASGIRGPLQIERFEALLPLLLHPFPHRALVIGLGSGITAGTLSAYPGCQVDAVELMPSMVQAASFFNRENESVISQPNVRIIIEDGRQFLRKSELLYDIITTGPQHPAQAGSVNLYTLEYFERCRSRLAEGGIMSQWLPLYQLFPDDLALVLSTMHHVFPHVSVWMINQDCIVLGKNGGSAISGETFSQRFTTESLQHLLDDIDCSDPAALLSLYVASLSPPAPQEVVRILRDDQPTLEFSALPALTHDTVPTNMNFLLMLMETAPPPEIGLLPFLSLNGSDPAAADYRVAFSIRDRFLAARIYHLQDHREEALGFYFECMKLFPRRPNLGHYLAQLMELYVPEVKRNQSVGAPEPRNSSESESESDSEITEQ